MTHPFTLSLLATIAN